MPEEFVQVNTNLTKEDAEMLDHMMQEKGYVNRSAFVRWLIRQEYIRQNQQNQNQPLTVTVQ